MFSFEEYLDVVGFEIVVDFILVSVLMGMENICKEEVYEWLKFRDKFVRVMIIKVWVFNDMFGYEVSKRFDFFDDLFGFIVW